MRLASKNSALPIINNATPSINSPIVSEFSSLNSTVPTKNITQAIDKMILEKST